MRPRATTRRDGTRERRMRVGPLARCVARPKRATYSHVATRAPWRYSAPRLGGLPARQPHGVGAPADAVARLEDDERPACAVEGRRRREPRRAGADDDASRGHPRSLVDSYPGDFHRLRPPADKWRAGLAAQAPSYITPALAALPTVPIVALCRAPISCRASRFSTSRAFSPARTAPGSSPISAPASSRSSGRAATTLRVAPLQLDPERGDQSTYFVRVNAGQALGGARSGTPRGPGGGAGPGAGRGRGGSRTSVPASWRGWDSTTPRRQPLRPDSCTARSRDTARPGPWRDRAASRPRRARDVGADAPRAGATEEPPSACISRPPTSWPAPTRSAPSSAALLRRASNRARRVPRRIDAGGADRRGGHQLRQRPQRRAGSIRARAAGCSCSAGRRHLGGAPGRSACSTSGRGSSSSWPGRIWPRIPASRRPQARRENWAELRPIIAAWLDRFTSADDCARGPGRGPHPVRARALARRGRSRRRTCRHAAPSRPVAHPTPRARCA